MTIIHISTKQSWRGGEQQIAYLVSELKAQGVDQIVMSPLRSKLSSFCDKHSIQQVLFSKSSGINISAAFRLKKLCKSVKDPVVHAHDSHAHTIAFLSSFLFGNNTPQVISRRVDFPVHRNFLSQKKYNCHNIKRILCVSNKISEIVEPAISNKDVLRVIHSGIDLARFNDCGDKRLLRSYFNIPDDYAIVGNVAALAPHKDYYTFVDTAERVLKENPKVFFLIIGQGNEKQSIAEYIFEKGLQKSILFTGFRTDIPDILPELDVFLITSETEGLGTSILDAQACGVPVVATRAGGIPEIVTDQKTGLLADVKDAKKLAENVLSLLNDNQMGETFAENAKKEISNFTRQETARKTIVEYKEIVVEHYKSC